MNQGVRHHGLEAALREDAQGRQVAAAAERAEAVKRAMRLAGFRWTKDGVVKDAAASAVVLYAPR